MKQTILFSLLFFSYCLAQGTDFICPGDGLFENPNSRKCDTFYSCADGLATLQHCAFPTVFREELQTCDHPKEGDCPDLKPASVCAKNEDLIPNIGDCTTYFQCSEGRPLLRTVAPGTYWDRTTNFMKNMPMPMYCKQAFCAKRPKSAYTDFIKANSGDSDDPIDCEGKEWTAFQLETNTIGRMFYYCWGRMPVYAYCCDPNEEFDENSSTYCSTV